MKNKIDVITLLAIVGLAFNSFSQVEGEKIKNDRNNLVGANLVYLGGDLNHGLEFEYRRILQSFNIRGAIGVYGINSNRNESVRIMGVDEDGIVNKRHSSEEQIASVVSLGLEKSYNLPINGDLFLSFDLLYLRILQGTSYIYTFRDYNSTEPEGGMVNNNMKGGYSREVVKHEMGLNINLGIKFDVTQRFSIIPKVTKAFQYSSFDQRLNNESGEALFNENIQPPINGNVQNSLNYSIAFNWGI